MQLSDTDKKLIERLKNQQQSWIRWRWIGLIVAFINVAVGCYGFALIEHFLHQPETIAAMFVSFLIPTVYLLVLGGVWLATYMLVYWNGKPEARLLLRLMEDAQKDDVQQR